jgi:hypothetical protein
MILSLFNCADQPIDIPTPSAGERAWSLRFSSDASAYGGADRIPSYVDALPVDDSPKRLLVVPKQQTIRLPAWSAALYLSQ